MYWWAIFKFFLLYSIICFNQTNYLLFLPVWRVKGHSSLSVFVSISQNIHALKASSVSDSKVSVSLGSFVPLPDLAENESDCSSNSKSVCVKIRFVLNFPVPFSPKCHSVGHTSSWVSDSGPECFWTVENPLSKSQWNFWQNVFLSMPIELEFFSSGVRLVLLNSITDIPKNLGFGGVVNFRMIFNLVDGSQAKIGWGNCLLCSSRKFDNRNVESSGCFLKDLQCAFLFCLHVEFDNIIKPF